MASFETQLPTWANTCNNFGEGVGHAYVHCGAYASLFCLRCCVELQRWSSWWSCASLFCPRCCVDELRWSSWNCVRCCVDELRWSSWNCVTIAWAGCI